MHFKTTLSKKHLNVARSKNAFQNCSFKKYLKIAPSKNALQNCYHKDIFINASINAVKSKAERDKSLIMHN